MSEHSEELQSTAKKLASRGKGILAVDESINTCGKRLADIGLDNTEENRQAYRGMLFMAPGLGSFISGAILFEETLYQNHADGDTMVAKLKKQGIIPGIKVDTGLKPLTGALPHETYCCGLDGLTERAIQYYIAGARFAKWRAVLQITNDGPSDFAITENAWGLARYARAVQEAGLVPIIEPEILMDGDHTIDRTAAVQEKVIRSVYDKCFQVGVLLEGTLLKPSMTICGADCTDQVPPGKVAEYTTRTLKRSVPAAVAGINFLSGGLSEEAASIYLNEMNKLGDLPWNVSFSYGRALQHSALRAWGGRHDAEGQKFVLARAQANSEASTGVYLADSQPSSDEKLFVAGYSY